MPIEQPDATSTPACHATYLFSSRHRDARERARVNDSDYQAFVSRLRTALRAGAKARRDGRDRPAIEAPSSPAVHRRRGRRSAARRTQRSVAAPEIGRLELACRWLALLFVLIVAGLSLQSSNPRAFQDLIGHGPAAQLDELLEIVAAATLAVVVLMLARRSNLARRLRMSWPLLLLILLYLGGFALLVSSALGSVLHGPLSMLAQGMFPDTFRVHVDAGHVLAYLVFALLAMIGWRRVNPELIALVLIVYGLALETAQLTVPNREFSVEDLVSNSLGVVLGVMAFRTALWAFRPSGAAASSGRVQRHPRPSRGHA